MPKSESIAKLTEALSKAQIAFLPIKRTEKVDFQTTSGRKKYNYAPLEAVIEATKKGLSDNGLVVVQTTKLVDGDTILETLLCHTSGEWLLGESYVGKKDQPPQSEGSALTYKRRYSMSAILCIASEEDDDAESASKEPEKKEPGKTEHFCKVHGVPFSKYKKDNAVWWSHKWDDGSWCNETKIDERVQKQAEKDIADFYPEKSQPAKPVEAPPLAPGLVPVASESQTGREEPPTDRETWLKDNLPRAQWGGATGDRAAKAYLLGVLKVSTKDKTLVELIDGLNNEDFTAFEAKINSRIEAVGK